MGSLIVKLQPAVLWLLFFITTPLAVVKARRSFREYKKILARDYSSAEKEYSELLTQEANVYDTKLKEDEKLSEIISLYEIMKDMSASLRFVDIFKILADYLQKKFFFSRSQLILIKDKDEITGSDTVYETFGLQDSSLKAKGIIPKVHISARQLNEHDKKIYGLLKQDIRRLEVVRTNMKEDPYLRYLPDGAKTYMVVPLMIDNQLIGILTIEDLHTTDFEKFSILAAQFALEARRIVLYERIEEMAITDGLTKAYAKRHIMERIVEEFERSQRHNFELSFLMIDIDHFKNYNDTYGHLVGDIVLRDIVTLVKKNTREVDLVGRFGGEEFCVILPETGRGEALLVAERLREIVGEYKFKAYDETTNVTVSIGMASYPRDAKNIDELLENSDKALYKAKHEGRNRVCVF